MNKQKLSEPNDKKIISIIIAFTVLVFIFIVFLSSKQAKKEETPLFGEMVPSQGAQHVLRGQVPEYIDPPTSGPHYGDGVAGAGIHDEPVEDGLVVHSLEHGAVVLSYDSEKLNQDDITKLKSIFNDKFRGKKIMVPRKNMSVPIIMTSWGRILKLESIDEEKMVGFMVSNNDRGPEKASI